MRKGVPRGEGGRDGGRNNGSMLRIEASEDGFVIILNNAIYLTASILTSALAVAITV